MRAGIVGASGYTGAELMRILAGHPEFEVTVLTANRYEGEEVTSLYPSLDGYRGRRFSGWDEGLIESGCDVLFVGLPHGESMKRVPGLVGMGKKVVDLSADFRLPDPGDYRAWYGESHCCPELLDEAVYGLPEFNRERIKGARLVANPGCYPTAAVLALKPLEGLAAVSGPVVIDAKSGVSGAGRKLSLGTHFTQAADGISPYSVAGHRHLPEIEAWLSGLTGGGGGGVVFTPHLAPMNRGILCTAYVHLGADGDPAARMERIRSGYEGVYGHGGFVRLLPEGEYPGTKNVQGSNNCHVALESAAGGAVLVAMSAIDNLVKGASGQAVQNMNIMCGFPEEAGLAGPGLFP